MPREIPPLEALMRGLSLQDLEVLQLALEYFDESYRAMCDRLKSLNASQKVYAAVNRAIKIETGKSRSDVDLFDRDELTAWGDGYSGSAETIDNLGDAAQKAAIAFRKAMQQWRDIS